MWRLLFSPSIVLSIVDALTVIYQVTVGHDCTYQGYFYVNLVSTLFTQVAKPKTVVAYPNPSDGKVLNVEIEDPGTHTIYLYNSSGVEIYKETVTSPLVINIAATISSQLLPGIYLMNIITPDSIAKKRIIIE